MIRLKTNFNLVILLLLSFYINTTKGQQVNHTTLETKGAPVVVASAAPQNICDGEQTILTATGSLGTPPYSYVWDNGLGTDSTYTINPAVSTTYNVTITDNNGLSSTDQVNVTVFNLPSSGLNANPTAICEGSSSVLDANPSGNAPFSFVWNSGLSGNQSHTVSPAISTNYQLTITDANGCTVTDNLTLTVNQNPIPTASTTSATVCSGGTTTLSATAAGGAGSYSYNWSGGLGLGASHLINPTMNVSYTVTVTDANGCSGTDMIGVNTWDLPAVNASAFPTSICSLETGSLSAIGLNGTGPYNYTWDNGLGAGANQIINPVDTTTYTVTVTDINGCTGTDDVTVNVWELPSPTASASPTVICENTSTILGVSSTGGVSPYSYDWSDGLGVGPNHTVFPTSDETYVVTVADDNGCTSTDQVTVTVNSVPSLSTSANPNPVCSGEAVILDATGSGTMAPYSYFWNNGLGAGQNHTVNPTISTTYNVTVTDGNGCTAANSATVNTIDNPSPNPVATPNPICPGASSNLTVSSSNGLAPYTYIWDNGLGAGDNHNVTPATPTNYTVTATDAAGCSASANVLLDFITQPTITLTASPNPVCDGGASNINTTLTGGDPPFMFAWDNGLGNVQNPAINPLSTNTYTLTVTDSNGCTTEESITVTVSSSPTVSATATPNTICPGQSSNLTATGAGGTAPYSFFWDNGLGNGGNHTVSPGSTTIYTVTVTDAAGCTAEDQITLQVYDAPSITVDAFPNPICALEITNLSATARGGTPGYTFTWDHGLGIGANHTITPAADDTYSVTVTDANGCEDIGSVFVQVVELPTVSAQGVPNPVCQGENVLLNAIGNNGNSPYSFMWNQGLGVGQTHTVAPATSTSYTVTISDGNGCTAQDIVNVTIWDLPSITTNAAPNPICPGDISNLSATANGSTPPYTYFWDNGLGLGANHIVSPPATNTYTVLVSDGNGCTANSSVTLNVTNMPPATPIANPNPVCAGDAITLDITGNGGTPPYTYVWNNGLGAGQTHNVNPLITTNYTVTVTDASGCTSSGTITANVNTNPVTNLTANPNPICETGSTTLFPNVSGGLAPYTFNWDNGLPSVENPTVTPLVNTTYNLTVTDSNGCTFTDQVSVTLETAPTVSITGIPNPVCSGELVNLSATGAGTIPPYSFTWNNGLGAGQNQTTNPSSPTTYTVTVQDGNGCTAENSILIDTYALPDVTANAAPSPICSGETVNLTSLGSNGLPPYNYLWDNGLGAGQNQTVSPATATTYTVTITDGNGCSNTDQVSVDVNSNPNTNLSANPNPICEGSNSTLFPNPTGGTAPYSFTWDNSLPGIQNPVVSPIVSTTYNLTITDVNGCSSTDQLTINLNTAPSVTTNATPDPVCPNSTSTISANGSGTTGPYTFFWDNGLGAGNSHTITPSSTSTYNVTVTDALGCTATSSVTVTTLDEPLVTANIAPDPICSGENASLTATGSNGSLPYTYVWDQGIGAGQNHIVNPIISTTYTVTITDNNGCTSQDGVTVSVNDLPSTNLVANPNPICNGESSTMNLTVSNGTAPYNYSWNHGLGNIQNPLVSPNSNTFYSVTVTDAIGCTVEDNVTVLVNDQPNVTLTASPNTICGGQTSTLNATGSGGTAPYSFVWDNGLTPGGSHLVNPVNTTTYNVSITDANGCSNTASTTITISNSPDLNLIANPNPICSLESVFLSAFAGNGTAPYTFNWDNGLGAGATHWDNPAINTTYSVTVTDALGCQDIETIDVAVSELPVVTADAIPNPVCDGDPVNLNASSTNGLAPYSYSWDSGLGVGNAHTVNPSSDHTYTVTVTDDNGCTAEDNVIVIVGGIPTISTSALPNPVCSGEAVNISATGSGTTAPYSYFWLNGVGSGQNQTVNPINDSTYTVVVTDANGCTGSQNLTINTLELPVANPTANPNPLCQGESTILDGNESNGMPPYSYNWDNALGAGQTQLVSPASDITYNLTITDSNGCSSTNNLDLFVNPLPTLSISATPNPVCGGEDAFLLAEANGTSSPYTYVWDNGLGNGQSHIVNPLTSTTYSVTATDDNGCSVSGNILLNAFFAPTVSATASPNTICEGQITTLDANGAGGSPAYTYVWDNGLGIGQSFNESPAITTMYHVTLTDMNGCTATDSVNVIVNQNPVLNLTASPQVLCEGNSSTLTSGTSGGIPPYTYSWTPAMGNSDSHVVTPAVSTSYTVSVSDANSCTSEDNIIITVNESPSITLNAAPNPICFNSSTNLTTNVSGGTPAYTYLWDHSLSDQPSHTVTLTADDTYNVTVSDINGCTGTDAVSITVNPEILISANINNQPDCFGNPTASFEISISGGTANYDINWTNGTDNGNFIASAGGPHTVNNVPAGNYQIDVTDAAGCTESYNFTINEPLQLSLNLDTINDISCNGLNDGSLDYTITGGTGSYIIDWDNGSSTDNIPGLNSGSHSLFNLLAGNYDITLTDANGCQVFDNFSLIEPSPLSLTSNSTNNVSCLNGNDGNISVDISGGTSNYSISWDNGISTGSQNGISAGTHQITNLTAGSYSIILTDANGCTTNISETISEPATELELNIVSITDASCVGVNDGAAQINVTGGIAPYTIIWDHPNGIDLNITNVTAGDYHVTVTDDWGCEKDTIVTIGQPANGLSASPTVNPVSCSSNNDGSIDLNTSGGTAPYNYVWSPAVSTDETANGLASGDYDVIISDAGSCILMLTVNVPVDPNTLNATVTDTTHVSCFGGNDGEITVTASNGFIPYSYAWNGYVETSNTLSNLPAGSYEVTVSDNLGCEIILNQNIIEPTPLAITEDSIEHILCNGGLTGSIFTTPNGGTLPYNFNWEDDSGTDLGINSDDISGLTAGTYHLFLSDANGCGPTTASFVINEPVNPLSANISIDSLPSCPGLFDGGLSVTANGGTAPYTYVWDAPIAGNTDASQTLLGANNYSVTITDANSCTTEANIILNDPTPILISTSIQNTLCFGDSNGEAIAQVSGGSPAYTYLWTDALNNTVSIDDTAVNLSAGDYFLTVTDANSCNAIANVNIGEPDILSATTTHTDVSTWGNTDGSASVNPVDGTPAYSYEWEDASNPGIIISTNQTVNNLSTGTYNITVTDLNGCIWTGSVFINEPNDPLGGNIMLHSNVLCAPDSTGALTATGFGGTPPYSYYWENSSASWNANTASISNLPADTYQLTITDALMYSWDTLVSITQPAELMITGGVHTDNLCYGDSLATASIFVSGGVPVYNYIWDDPTGSSSDNISNAPAGDWTVLVTDQNGCTTDTTITITQPTEINPNILITATPSCQGDSDASLSVTVSGGTAGYLFNWEDDASNVISTTDTLINIPAGDYYLTVTDANGCMMSNTINISEPPLLTGNINHTNASTWGNNDGTATVLAAGGTPNYLYNWEDNTNPGSTISTSDNITNLYAGTYNVTVTDANGCTWSGSVTITEPNDPLGGNIVTHNNIICAPDSTGQLAATGFGATPPYSYYWENSAGTWNSSSSSINNLPSDTYSLTITDANLYTWDTTLVISQPAELIISGGSHTDVLCFGDSTGIANITVIGGIFPYDYLWDDPSLSLTDNISNAPAGTYTVLIEDQNGCTTDTSITIGEPAELNLNMLITANPLCYGDNNGSLGISLSGGTPGYNYIWENSIGNLLSLSDTLINVPADMYYLTVTDNNGCGINDSIELTEPTLLNGNISHTDVSTWGNFDGSATATPSGGTPVYTYQWENAAAPGIIFDTQQTADSLYAGTYNVTISDANGCEWIDFVIISEPNDPLGGVITLHEDVACAPDSSGNLSASAFGGTSPYSYYWENATTTLTSNTDNFFNIPAGSYFLTITDHLGYTWDTTLLVSQPPILQIAASYQVDIDCYGDSTGQASIEVTGGTPAYSYNWQGFASTNDTLFNLPVGAYPVTITDLNGCQIDTVIKINTADSIEMNFLVTSMPLCNGGAEGSLFVNMIGGNPSFSYSWEDVSGNSLSMTDTVTGLSTGTYYLTVNDANGCIQTDSVFLPEPDVLTVSLDGIDATGYGASDAYAWSTGNGGTIPYSYEWEDITNTGTIISTDDSLQNVNAGTYSLTLTDINGCTTEDQITLNEPDELLHSIIGSHVHCYGDSTGGAWIQVTGGVLPYTYSWTDASGTEIWTDSVMLFIPAGDYYVTVTDANGYTTYDSVTINQPPALTFNIDSIQDVLCFGDNSAYIDLNPTGGTAPYFLEWTETSDPATILDTDDFLENIFAGEYMLRIVDDSTCTYDTVINIIQPDSLDIILETQGNITCFGYNNGFIDVEILGGTPPYDYEWTDSIGTVIATGTDSIGNLAAGEYYLHVSDANSCVTDSVLFRITEPEPFTFSAVVDSVHCFGESTGSIQLNPNGGTPMYNYTWLYEGDTIPDSNFAVLFNLEAGAYNIYVSDNNLCAYDTSLNILQPLSAPALSLTLTDSLDCFGEFDAEITAQLNGGTLNYDLSWTNGAGGDGQLNDIIGGTHILSGIAGGTFTFTLEDHYGCSAIENIVVPIPDPLNISLIESHITCYAQNDGSILSEVSGGTLPYLYSWDGAPAGNDTISSDLSPGWHTLNITDAHGCSLSDSVMIFEPDTLMLEIEDTISLSCHGDTDASALAMISGGSIPYSIIWTNVIGDTIQNGAYISNLSAGTYYLDIEDANGCSISDSVLVFEPNQLSATTESSLTQCPSSADGLAVIHMDAGAGTPPYSYDWNNPEHSITDTAINLNAGWWFVTVQDANNCIYLDSVEVFSPDSLDMEFNITPVQCNDVPGSVVISTTGGTPSYAYSWSTGDSTGIVPFIAAGIHTVTVTDLHSCTWAEQLQVESVGSIHPEIEITEPVSCYGRKDGILTAIMYDGALPYSFEWNTGDTTQSIDELFAGTYLVEVTDNWGCIGYDTLTLNQPEGISIDFITQEVLCQNGSSGWAQAVASGGNGNFSYAWDATFYGNPYTNLSAGSYTVVATDQEGCSGLETVYIDEPDSSVYALADVRDVTCYGYNNGRALAQGFGGQPPYQYLWHGPGNDSIYQQQTGATLFPGNYYLEVSDANGCRYDTIVKIRQPSPIYVDIAGFGSPSCNGLEDGWIQVDSIYGGNPPYSIFINGGGISWTQQNPFIDSIPAGIYQVLVYDANQCLQNNETAILTLAESDEDCIRIPAAFSPNGDGFNDEWQIDHLDLYRRCLIQVYNRWGQLLYEGSWDDPFWDGTYDGNPVPTGAYIYYVNLGSNSRKPLTGTVTVIR